MKAALLIEPRRLIIDDVTAINHVMSRTALDGFPVGDVQKDFISKREKIPNAIAGLDGVYSLKRLAEK